MTNQNAGPYYSYSWHQSHDQATVLVMVPHDTQEEDIIVVIERNYLIAGVRGHAPTVKGRLYSNVDVTNSTWQLEPRASRLSTRERTTSSASTASTPSSYAFVSDPEISSSFAASLESGQVSEAEDPGLSPGVISPGPRRPLHKRSAVHSNFASRSASPSHPLSAMASYYSSLESLHSPKAGRLLTLYLEKDHPIIWPSLITGPVPDSASPNLANTVVFNSSQEMEHQYNMDPTSLTLVGLEVFDIRKEKESAFEYFIRAWHQASVPSSTMRLVTHYLPLHLTVDLVIEEHPQPGSLAYYFTCLGGNEGLAKLYLEAGMLHLEGAATSLLSSSYSSFASIRAPSQVPGAGGVAAWNRDREAAVQYFERAKLLSPTLDIPTLPLEPEIGHGAVQDLEMPKLEVSISEAAENESPAIRRRRKKNMDVIEKEAIEEIDNAWYLYIPGLVGAGTALLVVGIVGALSFSTWSRRNQG
ncbi:hypothetical protein AX16_002368 [Volvariella volvacea WC 439]|nr:hypothetical protein AX16_002368 [Volvariella volvacea WC 439]